YYLAPADKHAEEVYALIREGMRAKNVAALARTVLFRRMRTVLIRAHDQGMIANTLNFNYEVRSAEEAFDDVPEMKIEGEMLELAEHIIDTKAGKFDPTQFEDRYDAAVAELVKAKAEGRKLPRRKAPEPSKVVDLMQALRESAGAKGKKKGSSRSASGRSAKATARKRK